MRIMYDYQCFLRQKYGGISRYYYEIYKRIKGTNDINLPVIGSQNYYFSTDLKQHNYGSKIALLFMRVFNACYSRIYLAFNGRKIDILHPTYYVSYKKRTKPKLVVTVHDMIHEIFWSDSSNKGIQFSIRNKADSVRKADHIITVSEKTKEDLLKYFPELDENRISVIYHGYNDYSDVATIDMKARFGKYILFVGARGDYKNFDTFIKAAADVIKKYSDIRVICTGGGKFTEGECALIKNLGIADKVTQISATDDELINLYRDAMCFVFPSLYEGFGIPILESFSSGCPVLLSNSSCFPEIGEDAALYFDGSNKDDIASKIIQILEDENLRKDLITKGFVQMKKFSWDVAAQKTLDIYGKVLKEN